MTSPSSVPAAHTHGPLLARLLDLDAIVQSPMLEEAVSLAVDLVGAHEPDRVLDIGAGTGTGSIALARRFPSAEIVAVDINDAMLDLVRERARTEGVRDRVVAVNVDIASPSARLGVADLVWSSAALHEVADPGRAFRNMFEALRPGGHLVVVEMDGPPSLLPEAFAALEQRLRSAAGPAPAAEHPEWTAAMEAAGFEVLFTRTLATDRAMPADGPAGDYAALELRRVGHRALPSLNESDRLALRTLAGDAAGNVRELGTLRIRSTRTLWAARRPEDTAVDGHV